MISFFIIITIALIFVRLFLAQNSYEKIISFYFIFSNIALLILSTAIADFESILDIIIILFLVQIAATLFLISNRNKT